MSGCSADMNMPDTQGTGDFGTVRGGVYGGQQPITGSEIFVFQTPTSTGYGNTAPVSLIGNAGSTVTCPTSTTAAPTTAQLKTLWASGVAYLSPGLCYYQSGGFNGTVVKKPVAYGTPTNGTANTLVGDGGFNLTGLYKCTVGQEVWLYAYGGFPTSNTANNNDYNPYATELAALGMCPESGNFSADSFIYMNELSTVAMAYAVAGFAADPTTTGKEIFPVISGNSSKPAGLTIAFNNAQQLYSIFGPYGGDQPDSSAPQTTPYGTRNGTPPYLLINTLGDDLAACINSAGNNTSTSSISTSCNNFFSFMYPTGTTSGTVITDTASAMIHVAKNPSTSLSANTSGISLLSLAASNPVWIPYYTSTNVPPDTSAAILYSGAVTPKGIVLDPYGNAFVSSYQTSGYLAELNPLGVVSTTSSFSPVINDAASLTVDSLGYIWAPSASTGAIYQATTNATMSVPDPTSFTAVTTAEPAGTLSDSTSFPHVISASAASSPAGLIFIADPFTNSGEIYETHSGASSPTIITASSLTTSYGASTGCVTTATGVALDSSTNYMWVTGYGSPSNVCRINTSGTAIATTAAVGTTNGLGIFTAEADAVAATKTTTGASAAWVLNEGNESLYEVTSGSGTAGTVTGPFQGGGMTAPIALAVDGAGSVWVLNNPSGSNGLLSEFTSSGAPVGTSGYQSANLLQPLGLGIDIAGDVWVSNFGNGNVVEVIGLATPTAALVSGKPGQVP